MEDIIHQCQKLYRSLDRGKVLLGLPRDKRPACTAFVELMQRMEAGGAPNPDDIKVARYRAADEANLLVALGRLTLIPTDEQARLPALGSNRSQASPEKRSPVNATAHNTGTFNNGAQQLPSLERRKPPAKKPHSTKVGLSSKPTDVSEQIRAELLQEDRRLERLIKQLVRVHGPIARSLLLDPRHTLTPDDIERMAQLPLHEQDSFLEELANSDE